MLGRKVGERIGHGLLDPEVREIAATADVFVANLECCISDRGQPTRVPLKPFFFRAPPSAAEWLAEAGVACVTLANNHVLDFGEEALADTLDHLRAAGVSFAGAGPDEAAARSAVVLEAAGVPVKVVAVGDHPSSYAAGAGRPGIAFADLEAEPVPAWLRAAVAPDDGVTIVAPHWGPNMRAEPLPYVRSAAAALEAADATLIAGHSAHVPQGASGRTLFDLGDFLDDYRVDPRLRNDLGLLWLVTLDAGGPVRIEGVPLRLEYCHTRRAAPEEARLLHGMLQERCAAVGSTVREEGDRFVFSSTPSSR